MERGGNMGIDELVTFLFTPLSQVGLIIGVAEIIKKAGLESRYIPLVDIGLGLLSGIGVYGIGMGYGIVKGIVIGRSFGLEACGIFSGFKNVVK